MGSYLKIYSLCFAPGYSRSAGYSIGIPAIYLPGQIRMVMGA